MTPTTPLSELFQVKARFYRSVSIVTDYDDPRTITDYILSPLSRGVLRRIGQGLQSSSRVRAWSIVGPYGAGKSAFALFLAKVLGYPRNTEAREQLRLVDPDLHIELTGRIPGWTEGGFLVVPIVGHREPLALAVLRGLAKTFSANSISGHEFATLADWLNSLCQRIEWGEHLPTAILSEAVERAAQTARSSKQYLGLLIVLDELGKLLEYAALNPAHGDVSLLQTMAELAARSGNNPIGLVVVLHQAFERYAARLSVPQQREWAKVQGRFEDIGFLESAGELLKLLAETIRPRMPLDGLAEIIAEEVTQARELDLAPRELGWSEAEDALRRCAPLHPTVSLVLGRLFRSRLAQNERSLFAFLTSGEPHGFQEYLTREVWTGNGRHIFYRLDQLYDYVLSAMGSALYSLAQGKRWAEIEDALERLPRDCTPLHARLVKVIGLLGLLGDQRYLKASERVLDYALSDNVGVTSQDVHAAIERLCNWGIAVYRQHKDAYSLWEGSDVDLEEQFQKGVDQVDKTASLAFLLQSRGQPRPYLAKRHLHETGTLRYFVPWVVDVQNLQQVLDRPFGFADGAIVFVIGDEAVPTTQTIGSVLATSRQLSSPHKDLLLFAIPQDTLGIRQALEEVLAWEWVAQNTPQLEGDSVARKELAGRRIEAESRLIRLCARCFDKTSSYASSLWVYAGEVRHFSTAAELSSVLSGACDRVYHAAPVVRNELINRRTLSSAATAARRTLIEHMLAFPTKPRLGIVGFPPELSMYRSVLEFSGLHHPAGSRWEFGPSDEHDLGKVKRLWEGIDAFLDTTENGKRCITDLFRLLREPPYGIKEGLLPVYLAATILHWDAEIALYENGSFVPKVDIAVFERLIRIPEQFFIQRYRLGQARSYLFERYSALLGKSADSLNGATLLTAVRPLLAFVRQLPPYTRLTQALGPETIKVREAILAAREPQRLLFEDLPAAVGLNAIQADADMESAQAFFAALRKALLELQRAYDTLLEAIQAQLLDAMRLPVEIAVARQEIAQRALILQDHVADLRLKAFVSRLSDTRLADREWVESVASCLANKPPKQWNDHDLLVYGIELAEIAGRFRRVEEIVLDARHLVVGVEGTRVMRLGVTTESGEEQRDIVRVMPDEEASVHAMANILETELRRQGTSTRLSAAAIAEVARRVLATSPSGSTEESR